MSFILLHKSTHVENVYKQLMMMVHGIRVGSKHQLDASSLVLVQTENKKKPLIINLRFSLLHSSREWKQKNTKNMNKKMMQERKSA
jgi:hypothetical protein